MSVDLQPWLAAVPGSVIDRFGSPVTALVVSHENPDADTLGAGLAVGRIVESRGGRADLVCSDPAPPLYGFMPGIERYRTDPDPALPHDLLIVVDCGSLDRVGPVRHRHAALFDRLPRLVIDHHASSRADDRVDWVDPASAATCEMVALLAVRLGLPLDAGGGALASALMAGIVMDTATFAHPNATPRTLAVSAALVAAGAPLSDISRRLYRTKPDAQLRLFGRILERLQSTDDDRIVWSTLTDEDLTATGAIAAYSEGAIDLLSQAESAEVTILFKQQGSATRISVRTRPGGVDATALAGVFGGGGHARAAGATVPVTVADAQSIVVGEARRLVAAVER